MKSKLIEVGHIYGTHGFKGNVNAKISISEEKFESLAEEGKLIAVSKTGEEKEFSINGMSFYKDRVIIQPSQPNPINDKDSAIAAKNLIGQKLFTLRSNLGEKDEMLMIDLIGLTVMLKTPKGQKEYGKVLNIYNFGAGDLIETSVLSPDLPKKGKAPKVKVDKSGNVKQPQEVTEMYMFNKSIFPIVNIEEGFILLNKPEVIFEDSVEIDI